MHLRARWSDQERKRAGHGLEKTARQKEREREQSIHKGGLEPVNHGSTV